MSRSRFSAVLVAALAVAGCNGEPEPASHYRGDVSFSEVERAAIEDGNAWLAERVGDRPFDIVWDLPPGGSDEPRTIVRGGAGEFFGTSIDQRIKLDVDEARSPDEIVQLAAHELAHARGMEHYEMAIDDPPGLMSVPLRASGLAWTEKDQAECERSGACR